MSEVNYKALMANDVSIMNLSENEIFSSFIVIDQNNKQYYVGAYDLDHLSDFVNANEPVSDFSAFQDTLRNYFFSTASSESVPNTSDPDELLQLKHLNEFARQLNYKLDGDTSLRQRTPKIKISGKFLENNLARVGFSELSWNAARNILAINLTIDTGVSPTQIPAVNPDFVNITSSDENINFVCGSFTWYRGTTTRNTWYMSIGPSASSSDDKHPVTFTFQIQIPAGDGYDTYLSPVITMEIYDDSI